MKLLSVKRIWHDERHNAFTDLCHFKNTYYLAFRTAKNHYSIDGQIQILSSQDGDCWHECATLSLPDSDLRDPKFSLHPDGRLQLHTLRVTCVNELKQSHSMVFFSNDGSEWDHGHKIGEANIWMWRAKWQQGQSYSIGYCGDFTRLYRSCDGLNYSVFIPRLFDQGYSNESDWVYLDDGTMVVLLRRDGKTDTSAMLGLAQDDYSEWTWHDLKLRIGGPALLKLNDDFIIAAIRTYSEKNAQTELYKLDVKEKNLQHLVTLPSSGDCSYAGIIRQHGEIWVSYYSSHEDESTDIYLAKLQI